MSFYWDIVYMFLFRHLIKCIQFVRDIRLQCNWLFHAKFRIIPSGCFFQFLVCSPSQLPTSSGKPILWHDAVHSRFPGSSASATHPHLASIAAFHVPHLSLLPQIQGEHEFEKYSSKLHARWMHLSCHGS